MEIEDNDNLRFFELIDRGNHVHISSPRLDKGLKTFKEKRLFYKRFKNFERILKKSWSARTNIDNVTMIKILTKLGAVPWWIDIKQDKMYFFKRKSNENI